jgi:hypothetical protein
VEHLGDPGQILLRYPDLMTGIGQQGAAVATG